jgi:cell division protein FtsA
MNSDLVAVLDLGSTKVTCLAASADGAEGMSIEGISTTPCRGMRRGQVADLAEVSRAIEQVVRKVELEVDEDIESLVVGISGSHIEGICSQGYKPIVPAGRKLTHQDVLEVINHSRSVTIAPDREQIQSLPREFRVDGQRNVQKPVGMSGSKLEVLTYIATGQTSSLQNIEQAVTGAGKRVEQMVLQSLASGVGILTPEEMDLGAAVVDIGGSTTDIAIFLNGSIVFNATIPVGGIAVTSDLGQLLKASPEEAERLKLESGCAVAKMVDERDSVDVMQLGQPVARPMQRRVLCEIIQSRMREIANLVAKQIEKSDVATILPGGIVLTGGGSALPGADRLFEETVMRYKIRIAEPSLGPKFPKQVGMATAVGLASFTIQCFDELTPAEGVLPWRDRVKSLFSMLSR